MPNPAKLEALVAAGFKVRATCGTCRHFTKPDVLGAWGWCAAIAGVHSKHTDGGRMSVRQDGICPRYEGALAAAGDLLRSGFIRFLEE